MSKLSQKLRLMAERQEQIEETAATLERLFNSPLSTMGRGLESVLSHDKIDETSRGEVAEIREQLADIRSGNGEG